MGLGGGIFFLRRGGKGEGDGGIFEGGGEGFAYFYFDKFLDSIYDKNMFMTRWTDTDLGLITRAHPSTISICIGDEGFVIRFFIIEIAEHDGFGLDDQFTRLVQTRDFDTFWIDQFCAHARDEGSAGAEPEIFGG